MKLYKVFVHNKGFCGEDLIINPKDFPNLQKGDVVEIYHPEDEFSRLLLQITLFKDDMQGRDAISVEQSIATTFQLRTYADVHVNKVNQETVALDSVEIIFKDQYMGRSEMWRLKNSLAGTCVYLHKKLEFCGGSVRCQVYEMWSQGNRVACGVIVDTTKIVFRSSTSMVYLFLQMSSEMWDFDIHGDLYFEKAVNGFLTDLFQKWKSHGSNHEVTIVLFSRTFYLAQSLDEFPPHMRECLQKDYKGRYYEDFYRVAVQNERCDDWSPILTELRKLFSDYQKSVLEYNYRPGIVMPKAVNSTAARGNFLEVLNMSLNELLLDVLPPGSGHLAHSLQFPVEVFEKHYLDRSFDRTGQLSVVITPSVGVFEVDRELTNVTKQRVIDNGVGSDLVCLGEQPLHAVPLFKYHNKDSSITGDDYSMPHWINLSFFSSNKRVAYSNFVPRIKLPPKVSSSRPGLLGKQVTRSKALNEEDDVLTNNVVDYDAYDLHVFSIPNVQNSKSSRAQKKTSMAGIESSIGRSTRRKLSDPDIHYGSDNTSNSIGSLSKSPAIEIPCRHRNDMHSSYVSSTLHSEFPFRRAAIGLLGSETESPPNRLIVGSTGSAGPQFQVGYQTPSRPGRALINPFDPSHITIKLTSNRRRWTHIFPKGPTGNLIQQHHYHANAPLKYFLESSSQKNRKTSKGHSTHGTKRSQNFSFEERRRLVSLANKQRHILENKKTDQVTTASKAIAWTTLEQEFNVEGLGPFRDHKSLKFKYEAIKRELRKTDTCDWRSTGGGPPSVKVDTPLTEEEKTLRDTIIVSVTGLQPVIGDSDSDYVSGVPATLVEGVIEESMVVVENDENLFQIDWTNVTPRMLQTPVHPALKAPAPVTDITSPEQQDTTLKAKKAAHPIPSKKTKASASNGKPKPRPSVSTLPGLLSLHSTNKKSALLWGVTGEQEWTSALTTGVDWKSLTIPACLPITTDYFPDDVCLRTDYVFSDYNLLPDAVNADYARQRIIYRKPLQTHEVFQELISQRLAQGFQLIVDDNNSSQIIVGGQSGSVVAGSRSKDGNQREPRIPEGNPTIEYKLSIGRIFHRISLTGSEIRVTRYRPRHPYPPFNFQYWYRFQAPDHPTYGVSSISFSTEKLENFNWNYFDHYICTRGDADFALIDTLKYWRLRVFILPACQVATKKILEGSPHCNIYSVHTAEEQQMLIDNFLKYIETWINKIKRPQTQKKQRSNVSSNSPFRERLGSNRLPEKPRPRSGSKVLERTKASQSIDTPVPTTTDASHAETEHDDSHNLILKAGCENHEIIEHMKNPNSGVGFLSQLPSLPKYTFVSADAVQWLMSHVEGVKEEEQAISILQGLLKDKYICHASGDSTRRFIHGFYLYHIKYGKDELKDGETPPVGDLTGFENEWMEVEIKKDSAPNVKPTFLRPQLLEGGAELKTGSLYKESHLEMDVQSKSDRVEWGHIKYHAVYNPNMAYEIVVQWAAASGAIVADLIFGWARKAQSCGLQMVAIPADPFALPCSLKSDPLRGPVFIPVDVESLMGHRSYLFEEFEESTRNQRLMLFLEAIALKFGFIRCAVKSAQAQNNQFVHFSGNTFLLIPTHPCDHSVAPVTSQSVLSKFGSSPDPSASPRHEYISRLVVNHIHSHETRVGFLWLRNHMVSRRWKLGPTCATSDESFQNKLFTDFTAFCKNDDGRLLAFWNYCIEVSETPS